MSRYSNMRKAIPGVIILGRRQTDPKVKPGPAPRLDGITVRPRGAFFDSDYFAPPPSEQPVEKTDEAGGES